MPIESALRSAGRLLVRRPGAVLPYYGLVAGAADAARLPVLLAAVVVYVSLVTAGTLDPFLEELAALNPERLDPADPTGLPPAFAEAAADLVTPTVAVTVGVGVLAGFLSFVVASGVARAGALAAVERGLDAVGGDDPPVENADSPAAGDVDSLVAGVRGLSRRWRTFVGLGLVRWGLLVAAVLPFLAALVGALGTVGAAAPTNPAGLDQAVVAALLAALAGALVTAVVVLVVLALLAFAGPAVVVDDVGLVGALRRSVAVPFRHPGSFLLYAVVVVAVYVAAGVLAGVFSVLGVSRLGTLVSALAVTPFADVVAVALYADLVPEETTTDETAAGDAAPLEAEGTGETGDDGFVWGRVEADTDDTGEDRDKDSDAESVTVEESTAEVGSSTGRVASSSPSRGRPGLITRLVGAFGDGLGALVGFVRRDLGYVVVAAVVLLLGGAAGWTATEGYGVRIPTPTDPAAVFGPFPLDTFVEIAANNWFVALTTGFSGLFAGLPTLGTLLFNGLLVGAVAGVVDPLGFVALVAPHGVVELPAIAVAGGVGLRLGHVSWGAWRGRRSLVAVADELRRAWRISLGLAVVFVVAAFVEAFLTPRIAALLLGG